MGEEGKKRPVISADTSIEELIEVCPAAVKFLLDRGIRCIQCGEPVWKSLGELLWEERVEDPDEAIRQLDELAGRGCGDKRPA